MSGSVACGCAAIDWPPFGPAALGLIYAAASAAGGGMIRFAG